MHTPYKISNPISFPDSETIKDYWHYKKARKSELKGVPDL